MKREISGIFMGAGKPLILIGWVGALIGLPCLYFTQPASQSMGDRLTEILIPLVPVLLLSPLFWVLVWSKRVWIDEDALYAKGLLNEIRVPFSQLEIIEPGWWPSPWWVKVRFKSPTRFGKSILFMTPFNLESEPLSLHPIAAELNAKIRARQP